MPIIGEPRRRSCIYWHVATIAWTTGYDRSLSTGDQTFTDRMPRRGTSVTAEIDFVSRDVVADLRIDVVEPIVLVAPTHHDGLYQTWQRGWTRNVLVRVQTRCGAEGYGIAESQPEVVRAIIEAEPQESFSNDVAATFGGLKALVQGESAANLGPLWEKMYKGTGLFGRRGAVLQAISAIDMACTDLLGRYLGISVSHLLGGRFRETVRTYASSVFPESPNELRTLAQHVSERGFVALKLGWGAFRLDTSEAIRLIDEVRRELPASVALIFDIGSEKRRSAKDVLRLIRLLEEYEPLWIEEPCHPDDLDSYRIVAREAAVPIAAGEACSTVHDFRQLIEAGVTVIQPDLSRCGGFWVAQQVAAQAAAANCVTVPHAWQNDLLLAATTHLCAMLPHEPLVEYSVAAGPLREICLPRTSMVDGVMDVPSGPGLGLTPDSEVIQQLRTG